MSRNDQWEQKGIICESANHVCSAILFESNFCKNMALGHCLLCSKLFIYYVFQVNNNNQPFSEKMPSTSMHKYFEQRC